MDYVALDLRTFFTPSEAAMAWCEITNVTVDNQHNYQHVLHEISEAIRLEELPAQIPVTHHDDWITEQTRTKRHPDRAKIAREDLKRWAEARGQKPKFLFPEMRIAVAEKCEAVPQENLPPKPLPPRENRMHGLLERVCLDLFAQYKRWPQAKEVLQALEREENNPDRSSKYDPDGIIQEIKGTTIYWQSDGADEPKMELKTLQNRIGILKENHKTQKAKRKIPA